MTLQAAALEKIPMTLTGRREKLLVHVGARLAAGGWRPSEIAQNQPKTAAVYRGCSLSLSLVPIARANTFIPAVRSFVKDVEKTRGSR